MLLLVHVLHALSCHKNTGEMARVIVGPLLPNALARVEESCQSGAQGSNFAGVGGSRHGGITALPKPWYGTDVFLPQETGPSPQTPFLTGGIGHDRPTNGTPIVVALSNTWSLSTAVEISLPNTLMEHIPQYLVNRGQITIMSLWSVNKLPVVNQTTNQQYPTENPIQKIPQGMAGKCSVIFFEPLKKSPIHRNSLQLAANRRQSRQIATISRNSLQSAAICC